MRLLGRRIAIVCAGTVGLVLLGAAPAWAHVTVNSPGATQGGYAVLTFRVPTESATASTTALKVQLPTDHPIASVSVQPHTGWSYKVITSKLAQPIETDDGPISEAVSEIDWSADSADTAIKPGEFDQFNVSAGPLPDVSSLTFKAIQTYSDASVVSWTEVQAPGSKAELEHPAPVLTLAAANASASGGGSSDTGAIILSIIALVVAVAAAGYAFVTRARQRGSA